jgi:phosphoglycerate dehydrogenase-like enzyme
MLHRYTTQTLKLGRQFHTSRNALARVLCTDGVDECCVKIFKERGHHVDLLKTLPENELLKIIGDYDGLVVRSATKVNANVLKNAKKMKIVGRAGVGVDNVDVKEATKCVFLLRYLLWFLIILLDKESSS